MTYKSHFEMSLYTDAVPEYVMKGGRKVFSIGGNLNHLSMVTEDNDEDR